MKLKPSKAFRIWTSQVNALMYEVKAESMEQAEDKVRRLWKAENPPHINYVEEVPSELDEKDDSKR